MNEDGKNSEMSVNDEINDCVDEEARKDMYNKYEYVAANIGIQMYKNYTKRDFTPSIDIEDVIQTAKMALWTITKKAKKSKIGSQTTQFVNTCVANSLKKYFKHITRYQTHEISNGGWGLLFDKPDIAKEIEPVDFTNKIDVNIFPDNDTDINDFCNSVLNGCTKTEALRNAGWTWKKFDENKDYIEKYLLAKINKREE